MTDDKTPRLDKYLWSVRIFKTRSLALEACKKGRVTIGGMHAKASRQIKPGEIIQVTKPPVTYSFKIINCPAGRISAKSVSEYIEDLTPPEELDKLRQQDSFFIKRDRGSGRPTKKERRLIDKIRDN